MRPASAQRPSDMTKYERKSAPIFQVDADETAKFTQDNRENHLTENISNPFETKITTKEDYKQNLEKIVRESIDGFERLQV